MKPAKLDGYSLRLLSEADWIWLSPPQKIHAAAFALLLPRNRLLPGSRLLRRVCSNLISCPLGIIFGIALPPSRTTIMIAGFLMAGAVRIELTTRGFGGGGLIKNLLTCCTLFPICQLIYLLSFSSHISDLYFTFYPLFIFFFKILQPQFHLKLLLWRNDIALFFWPFFKFSSAVFCADTLFFTLLCVDFGES